MGSLGDKSSFNPNSHVNLALQEHPVDSHQEESASCYSMIIACAHKCLFVC